MKRFIFTIQLLASLSSIAFSQLYPYPLKKENHIYIAGQSTEQFSLINSSITETRSIECMPQATYSNAPTHTEMGYVSNSTTGFKVIQRVHGFDNPIAGIRFFGVQGINTILGWMPVNEVDQLTFKLSFYIDQGEEPNTLLEDYTQTVTLSGNTTNEWFADGFEIFYYDFFPAEPIKNLPTTFWLSIENLEEETWFLWIDTPGGMDMAMQYALEDDAWDDLPNSLGICIVPLPISPDAPHEPTQLVVNPNSMGELSASVSWKNPTTTYAGNPLTQLSSVDLFINDNEQAEYSINNPGIGTLENYEFNALHDGLYKFTVVASNAAGAGLFQSTTKWLGFDVPAKPLNVTLSAVEGGSALQWDAPGTSLHGGVIDLSQTRYTITRNPGNMVVAEDYEGTEFTDIFNPPLGSYYYKITATNNQGEGGSAISNVAVLGADDLLLFELFDNIIEGQLPYGWVVEGEGEENWGVTHTENAGGNSPELRLESDPTFVGITRLVTNSFELDNEEHLMLSFKQYLRNYWPDGNIISVKLSFDGEPWITLWQYEIEDHVPPQKTELFFNVPATANNARVAWEFEGDIYTIYQWYIDEVVVSPVPGNDLKAVSITGDKLPTIGLENYYNVSVQNVGSLPQSQYSVKLMKAGGVEVASQEGVILEFGEEHEYEFIWIPQEDDINIPFVYAQVDFEVDEYLGNNKTANLPVYVQAEGTVITHIGTGNDDVIMPYNYLKEYSLSQNLYYADELEVGGGHITGIHYVNNFGEPLYDSQISIWMGEIQESDLSQGWVDPNALELVFEGTIDFPQGIKEVYIPLQNPYLYSGNNLVIYSYKEDNQIHLSKVFKNTYDLNSGRSRFMGQSSPFDPLNPITQGSTLTDYFPNIGVYFNIAGMATLKGVVSSNGVPIEGVEVSIENTGLTTTTDPEGIYEYSALMEGTYNVLYNKIGFVPHTVIDVIISQGETVVLDVSLDQLVTYTVKGKVVGEDGLQLSQAKVYLTGDAEYTAFTNDQGDFEIHNVYEGVYEITITSFAYKTHNELEIAIINNSNETIDLEYFTLQEIIVPPALLTVELDGNHRDEAMLSWDHNFMGSILLVDHDASNAVPSFVNAGEIIKASLQAQGVYFDLYESSSTPPYNGPSYEIMRKYDGVIWIAGEGWTQGQTMTEQDTVYLAKYIDNGGYLLFSGQDFLYDLYPSNQELTFQQGQFVYDYFGLLQVFQDQWWHGDYPTFHYQHAAGSDGSFAQGLTLNLQNLYTAKEGLTTDNIIVHEGLPIIDILENPQGVAAIKYENTIFSSASLEAIEDEDARTAFIIRGLNSFVENLNQKSFNGYALYLNEEGVEPLIQDNQYLFRNLLPKTTYKAAVKSLYTSGESAIKEITFTTYPPTGVSEHTHNLLVYPNPFHNYIAFSNTEIVKRVVITNTVGQRVMDIPLSGKSIINTEGLEPGMYIITLELNDEETVVKRVIKK